MGIRLTLTGVASSLVGLLKTRLELLSLEAAGEKTRLIKMLGFAFAALLFLTLAVLVFSVLVSVYFWPTDNRYLALGLLAALYGVIGVVFLLVVRHALLYDPMPFAATLSELSRDTEVLDRVRTSVQAESRHARREPY